MQNEGFIPNRSWMNNYVFIGHKILLLQVHYNNGGVTQFMG